VFIPISSLLNKNPNDGKGGCRDIEDKVLIKIKCLNQGSLGKGSFKGGEGLLRIIIPF
jgi:hypothetical protein